MRLVRPRSVCPTALALLLLSSRCVAQEAEVVHNVYLRQDPSTDNLPIRLLHVGERIVLAQDQTNGYYRVVSREGEKGWVWAKSIKVTVVPVQLASSTDSLSSRGRASPGSSLGPEKNIRQRDQPSHSKTDAGPTMFEVASLTSSVITSALLGWLAFLTLRHTAKPRVRIYLEGHYRRGVRLPASSVVDFEFRLQNVGHWFAKPAATNIRLYVNFPEQVALLEARYGSNLERREVQERRGKGNSKYFLLTGVDLFYGEQGERILVRVQAPDKPQRFRAWIASASAEGDHGVHFFEITVVPATASVPGTASGANGVT